MKKLSVLVPVYNEGEVVHRYVETLKNSVSGIIDDYEIIVVDDGSSDMTVQHMMRHKDDPRIRFIGFPVNRGKGAALRFGASHVKGDTVILIDGDGDFPPDQIKMMLEYMEKNEADFVVGSKRHPKSKINYPFKRKIFSIGYQMLNYLLFGMNIKDTQTGLKIVTKDCLDNIIGKVLVKRWAFDVELLVNAHRKGYKIIEAPVTIDYKFNGNGGLSSLKSLCTASCSIFLDTLAVAYRLYIKKWYDE